MKEVMTRERNRGVGESDMQLTAEQSRGLDKKESTGRGSLVIKAEEQDARKAAIGAGEKSLRSK